MLISKNLENRRKTTIVVMENGKITSENTTISQEFTMAMISERIKKGLGQEPRNSGQEKKKGG
jgi:hypothetical protein